MHIWATWAFQKCMNHRCAVIGVTANVTQWTPPRVGTDGQTEKFNTISRRFTGDNLLLYGIGTDLLKGGS